MRLTLSTSVVLLTFTSAAHAATVPGNLTEQVADTITLSLTAGQKRYLSGTNTIEKSAAFAASKLWYRTRIRCSTGGSNYYSVWTSENQRASDAGDFVQHARWVFDVPSTATYTCDLLVSGQPAAGATGNTIGTTVAPTWLMLHPDRPGSAEYRPAGSLNVCYNMSADVVAIVGPGYGSTVDLWNQEWQASSNAFSIDVEADALLTADDCGAGTSANYTSKLVVSHIQSAGGAVCKDSGAGPDLIYESTPNTATLFEETHHSKTFNPRVQYNLATAGAVPIKTCYNAAGQIVNSRWFRAKLVLTWTSGVPIYAHDEGYSNLMFLNNF